MEMDQILKLALKGAETEWSKAWEWKQKYPKNEKMVKDERKALKNLLEITKMIEER